MKNDVCYSWGIALLFTYPNKLSKFMFKVHPENWILCLLFCTYSFFTVVAQPTNVHWGAPHEYPNNITLFAALTQTGNGFLLKERKQTLIPFAPEGNFISAYDAKGNHLYRKEAKVKINDQWYSSSKIIPVGSGFVTFVIIEEGEMFCIYAAQLNDEWVQQKTKKLEQFPKRKSSEKDKFDVTTNTGPGAYDPGRNWPNVAAKLSDDKTCILVYSRKELNKQEPETFTCKMIDTELNELWTKSFDLPYKHIQVDMLHSSWDTLDAEVPDRDHIMIKGSSYGAAVLFLYNASTGKFLHSKMECGIYATKKQKNGTYEMLGIKESAFVVLEQIQMLNADLNQVKIEKTGVFNFTESQVEAIVNPWCLELSRNKDYTYANYPRRRISALPDSKGGYYIIYEDSYTATVTNAKGKKKKEDYNQASLISVNEGSGIAWVEHIRQRSEVPGFAPFIDANGISLLYEDQASDENKKERHIYITHVDQQARLERKVFADPKIDEEFDFMPGLWRRFGNELYLFAFNGKRVRVGYVMQQ